MAKDAYDILGMLGSQQMKNTELVGGLLDSGFRNATAGVRQASDILSTTVNSALNYKQSKVDEWYKAETLKQQEKQLDATIHYHNATLEQNDRQLSIQEQHYKDANLEQTQRTQIADRNKTTFGFLSEKRHLYETSIRGLQNLIETNRSMYNDLSKAPIGDPTEYRERQAKMKELGEKINGGQNQINNLVADLGTLGNTINGLANGLIDSDSALKELDYIAPQIKHANPKNPPLGYKIGTDINGDTFPEGVRPSAGSGLIFVPLNQDLKLEGDLDVNQNVKGDNIPYGEDNKFTLNEVMGIRQGYLNNSETQNLSEIRDLIRNKGNSEAQKAFSDKRFALERQYYENLFVDLQTGKDASSKFSLNPENFRKEYFSYGGDPESLDKINEISKYKYKEFSQLADDPMKLNKAIQEFATVVFPQLAKKDNSVDKNGLSVPNKVIGESGVLIKQDNQGNTVVKVPQEFTENRDIIEQTVDINNGGIKEQQAFRKVLGYALKQSPNDKKKTILSDDAISKIAGAPIESFNKFGLIDLLDLQKKKDAGVILVPSWKGGLTVTPNEEGKKTLNQEKQKIVSSLLKPENKTKALKFLTYLEQQ